MAPGERNQRPVRANAEGGAKRPREVSDVGKSGVMGGGGQRGAGQHAIHGESQAPPHHELLGRQAE